MTRFKTASKPSSKGPKASIPSAPVVSKPSRARVESPTIRAGEWTDVLDDRHGTYTITLDYGAFRWVWDLIENRTTFAESYAARNVASTPDFARAYVACVYRAVDAFRDEASRHDDTHVRKVEAEAQVSPSKKDRVVREEPLTAVDFEHQNLSKTGQRQAKLDQEVPRERPLRRAKGKLKPSAPTKKARKFKTRAKS